MNASTVTEIKKLLTTQGWMVYRTLGDSVLLAELVRNNLIMEAHVSVVLQTSVRVRFATRAQRSDFPSSTETDDSLLERARTMGKPARKAGFCEVSTQIEPIPDPMDPEQHLDVWYQVVFEKIVDSDDALVKAVGDAMRLEKVAPR